MKTPLSIQILTKDNQETIEDCLNSISQINCKIIIGDLGSKDKTIEKCLKFKPEIIKISLNDDISQARNFLIDKANTVWHLMIEPWEVLLTPTEAIIEKMLYEACAYKFHVLQGDLVTKETRLWNKSLNLKFKNPIYETIDAEAKMAAIYIISKGGKRSIPTKELAHKWKAKNPLSADPIYYIACSELIDKNWDTFLNYADLFLHQQKKQNISYFMTCYYMAMVLCYIKKDYQKAIQTLCPCIIKNPTLAEFWCLLADVYYAISEYNKAYHFYNNAKILGSRRLESSDYPMEISKYKDYPEKMMQACVSINENTNSYSGRI